MALRLSYDTKSGFTADQAYARISKVTVLHAGKEDMVVKVDIYYDEAAYQNGDIPIESLESVKAYDAGGSQSFAGLYEFFKTLPEYAGAVDVL